MESVTGDVRDAESLSEAMQSFQPEIVFHLAAQPIVLASYQDPACTYETNVMGTVNLLEAARQCNSVKSILNVTTDKVYKNNEWPWGYRETDELNGYDPYSNSKSCSELVTDCYSHSFFAEKNVPVTTARAGNVIGGGDFAECRIIPDAYRAALEGRALSIRSPHSVRPYQHVLEAVTVYLLLALVQMERPELAGCYNVGPDEGSCVTTEKVAELFCKSWTGSSYAVCPDASRGHEAGFLRLDCSKLRDSLGWRPLWDIEKAIGMAVELYRAIAENKDPLRVIDAQIAEYVGLFESMVKFR